MNPLLILTLLLATGCSTTSKVAVTPLPVIQAQAQVPTTPIWSISKPLDEVRWNYGYGVFTNTAPISGYSCTVIHPGVTCDFKPIFTFNQ